MFRRIGGLILLIVLAALAMAATRWLWGLCAPVHWTLRLTVAGWPAVFGLWLAGGTLRAAGFGHPWVSRASVLGMERVPPVTRACAALLWPAGVWLLLLDNLGRYTRVGRKLAAWVRQKRKRGE